MIDPLTRRYLFQSLQACHDTRMRYYSFFFNAAVFVFLVLLGGTVLYCCRKRKLTPFEEYQKELKAQQYVVSKIQQFQEERFRADESLTHLPAVWSTPPAQ